MRFLKNTKALLLVLLMILGLCLCACNEQQPEQPTQQADPTYKVVVKDPQGEPYTSGVIARFMQNGQQVSMQTIDTTGTAAKQLPAGEYTVELMFTDSDAAFYYDPANVTLTADKPVLEITLSQALGSAFQTLNAQGREVNAYWVEAGCTYVEFAADGRNYFLFAPTTAGMYEFSLLDAEGSIGYYGAPHFVQENNAAEVLNNTFTVSIKASMISTGNTGTTVLVIGVDAAEAGMLSIRRIGEPEHTVEDEPWTIYKTTAALTPYAFPEGTATKDFDLTAAGYTLVLGADNYYHLNTADGPLVLVKLGEKATLEYIDPFQMILDRSGVVKYFYDESGAFVKKESYSECLLEYFEYVDEASGLYPLTEDLKYIIQQRGDYAGWFDSEQSQYLFKDENGLILPNINPEISWLFMCCYIA